MITIPSLIGWLLVGGSIAWMICKRPCTQVPRGPGAFSTEVVSDAQNTAQQMTQVTDATGWCDAIEAISGLLVLVFDPSFKLVAMSKCTNEIASHAQIGAHIVDIIPGDIAGAFLDGAAAARRGEIRSWRCVWGGRSISVNASPVGAFGVIIAIRRDINEDQTYNYMHSPVGPCVDSNRVV